MWAENLIFSFLENIRHFQRAVSPELLQLQISAKAQIVANFIYFKNVYDKFWRKTCLSMSFMQKTEKSAKIWPQYC